MRRSRSRPIDDICARPVRVLIVKLSSLGDVVHAMPVVHDIRAARPGAQIDWVVEPAFAPVLRRVDGLQGRHRMPAAALEPQLVDGSHPPRVARRSAVACRPGITTSCSICRA